LYRLLGKINKSYIYKLPIIVFPYVVIVDNRTEIMDPLIACVAACLQPGFLVDDIIYRYVGDSALKF
jgi:hypothetical protein